MSSTTLILVRHGHMEDNSPGPPARLCGWCDAPLSALGRQQAARLSERLAAEPRFVALYSSPLCRAKSTAEAISVPLGLPVELAPALREIHCGSLDGMRVSEVERRYPELWRRNLAQTDESFCWPGGESYRGFRGRVLRAIGWLTRLHPGGRVLVVTHAGVVSQVLGSLAGLSAARWGDYRPGNASLTELRWEGDRGTLVCFDDRKHLG